MTTKFRNSFTHKAGADPAEVVQGRVVGVNLVKWTVDVVAQFDRKKYFQVQVASPYQNPNNGEGLYVVPEIGSTCMVCIPSDSTAPFVMAFLMPVQTVNDSSPDAPSGTSPHGSQPLHPTDASFAGNRPRVKAGDIVLRTRDNNFVILHRGGVLQIGATELSQRLFIPLRNLMTDISENYEHHNSNGSIVWGLQDGPSLDQYPSQYLQTFRVFATDQYADIRVAVGKVYNPIPEPDPALLVAAGVAEGDDGQGSNPIVYEVTVSPKGFVAQNGDMASSSTGDTSVLKFVFDRKGNTVLRTEGNFFVRVKKKLNIEVTEAITLKTDDTINFVAKNGFDISGGNYTHVKGDIVRLGTGQSGVARLGDIVSMNLIAAPALITFSSPPVPNAPIACTVTTVAPLVGSITTANPQVLA
jgi:hypothetical protein